VLLGAFGCFWTLQLMEYGHPERPSEQPRSAGWLRGLKTPLKRGPKRPNPVLDKGPDWPRFGAGPPSFRRALGMTDAPRGHYAGIHWPTGADYNV
jgi:hypothetical protein